MVQQSLKNQFKLKTLSFAKKRAQKLNKNTQMIKKSSKVETCKRIITLLSTTPENISVPMCSNSNYQKDNGCATY